MQEFQSINPLQPQGASQIGGTQSAEPTKNSIDRLISLFEETTGQEVPEEERGTIADKFRKWEEEALDRQAEQNVVSAAGEIKDKVAEVQKAVKDIGGDTSKINTDDVIEIGGEKMGLSHIDELMADPKKVHELYLQAKKDGKIDNLSSVDDIKSKVFGHTTEAQEKLDKTLQETKETKKNEESAEAAQQKANNPQSANQAKGFAVGKDFGTTGLYSGAYTDQQAESATQNNIKYAQTTSGNLEKQRAQSEGQLADLSGQLNYGVEDLKSGKIVGSEGPSAFDTKTKRPLAAAAAGTNKISDKMFTAFNISPSEEGLKMGDPSEGKTLKYAANQDGLGVLKGHLENIDGQIAAAGSEQGASEETGLGVIQGAQSKLKTEATELKTDKETQTKRVETVQKESASVQASNQMWDQGITAQQAQLDAAKAAKAGIAQTNKSDANAETLTRIVDLGAATAQLAAAWAMPAADPASAAAKAAAIAIAAAKVAQCTQAKNKAEAWEGNKDQELIQAQQRIDEASLQLDQAKQSKTQGAALVAQLDQFTAKTQGDLQQIIANAAKNSDQQGALGSANIAYTAGLQTDRDNLASHIQGLENSNKSSNADESQKTKGVQSSQGTEESSETGEEDSKEKSIQFVAYRTDQIESPASDESQNDPFSGINGLGKTQKKLMGSLMINPHDDPKQGGKFNIIA